MPKSLRDLLADVYLLETDLRDAGLFSAAGYLEQVKEAIRNREAYDSERGEDE